MKDSDSLALSFDSLFRFGFGDRQNDSMDYLPCCNGSLICLN